MANMHLSQAPFVDNAAPCQTTGDGMQPLRHAEPERRTPRRRTSETGLVLRPLASNFGQHDTYTLSRINSYNYQELFIT